MKITWTDRIQHPTSKTLLLPMIITRCCFLAPSDSVSVDWLINKAQSITFVYHNIKTQCIWSESASRIGSCTPVAISHMDGPTTPLLCVCSNNHMDGPTTPLLCVCSNRLRGWTDHATAAHL